MITTVNLNLKRLFQLCKLLAGHRCKTLFRYREGAETYGSPGREGVVALGKASERRRYLS